MITITDCKKLLRDDPEIKDLILNSSALKKEYRPRSKPKRNGRITTKSSLAMKYFMQVDGAKFRLLLERRGINPFNTRNMSKVQDALLLFLHEVMSE